MQFHYTPGNENMISDIVDALRTSKTRKRVSIQAESRSNAQNDYFYGYVDLISDHTGYTKEQTKQILKKGITKIGWVKMWTCTVVKGEPYDDFVSSSKLDTTDFAKLIKYTQQVCDHLSIRYKYDPVEEAKILFS